MPFAPTGDRVHHIDWHVHTRCSCDSTMRAKEACRAAVSAGLRGVCFTDHVNFDPRDEGVHFFNWDRYRRDIDEARLAFPDLEIGTGFELNWQRAYADEAIEFLADKPVDFVLGGVHWIDAGFITHPETYLHIGFEEFAESWAGEALDLLSRGVCQGFAHFDYFYLQTRHSFPEITRDSLFARFLPVVDALIARGVSLEINASAMRKGLTEPFPCKAFLQAYRARGGNRLHLGSDAHYPAHVGFGFSEVRDLLH